MISPHDSSETKDNNIVSPIFINVKKNYFVIGINIVKDNETFSLVPAMN